MDKVNALRELNTYHNQGLVSDRNFTINDDFASIAHNLEILKFKNRVKIINKIKELLKIVSYPVHPDILNINSERSIDEINNVYKQLLKTKEHMEKERAFFKLLYICGNVSDPNIKIPKDEELNKYCYGSKDFVYK